MAGKAAVVLGLQWGDEGKGKLVDMLSQEYGLVARCGGGNNAGHTVVVGDTTYDFHLLPSGIASPDCMGVIGNGLVVHLPGLFAEIAANEAKGLRGWQDRLKISDRAHVVLDLHQSMDALQEEARGGGKIGTTRKGIGPCYAAKAARAGARIADLVHDFPRFEAIFRRLVAEAVLQFPTLHIDIEGQLARYQEYADRMRPMVVDTVALLNDHLDAGKRVLVEGANATMLDIDFGTYPYVTSSNCTAGGACTGLGIPPGRIGDVYGVLKAYSTRVGDGGYPTEMVDEDGNETELCVLLRKIGHEYGVTTGRPRRCGWFDAVAARYAIRINGVTSLFVTKLDCLDTFDEIKVGMKYILDACIDQVNRVQVEYHTLPGWKQDITGIREHSKLPARAREFLDFLSNTVKAPIRWVGVGPARDATIEIIR